MRLTELMYKLGGIITTSALPWYSSFIILLNSDTKAMHSSKLLFIFQFPAIIFFLIFILFYIITKRGINPTKKPQINWGISCALLKYLALATKPDKLIQTAIHNLKSICK